MSDQRNDNPKRHDAHEPSIAELLRRAADDELTRPQRALLEAHLAGRPDDAARIEFERALRRHVGSAMTGARAPQSVRDGALAALRSAADDAAIDDAPPIVRRDRSFWLRSPFAPLALAAALLLALSAGILLQRAGSSSEVWIDQAQQASVVSFLGNEHNRCASIECSANPKWVANTVDDARAALTDYMGVAPERLDLKNTGFVLTGAGPCHVPGEGKSMHLLYRSGATLNDPTVSLFIQKTDAPLQADASCLCDDTGPGEVLMWRRDGLIYYLVCPDKAVADEAVASLGGPTRRVPI